MLVQYLYFQYSWCCTNSTRAFPSFGASSPERRESDRKCSLLIPLVPVNSFVSMKIKMFKRSQLILLSIVVLILVHALWLSREHLTMNKDNSKNWDVPERTDKPEPTPEAAEITSMKGRLTTLESELSDLKSKVNK
jgi:hypothetical protein